MWTTGSRLSSLRYAKILCLSSAFEATRMRRRTERAIFEKKPLTRLSQEPCLSVKTKVKRPSRYSASHLLVSLDTCAE